MLGGGILTITRRNAVHSAISLIVSLLGVAGLYLLQQAEFLFAVQIVLYIGGIMVLFLFVIMLVNLDQAAKERQFNGQWLIALVCVALVGAQIVYFLYRRARTPSRSRSRRDAGAVGRLGNTELLADVLVQRVSAALRNRLHPAAGGGGRLGGDGEEEDLTMHPITDSALPGAERGAAADRHGGRADPPQYRDHSDVHRADSERREHQPGRVLAGAGRT